VRVGAVDIGTNTARLLIADVGNDGSVAWVDRRVRVTGLGKGVDASGRLDANTVDTTVATLAAYGGLLRHHEVEAMDAVATSATRDAANRDSFLDRAGLALGARPRVVSGEEEAALSFAGVTHCLDAPSPHLVIDPGGGSTEFVLGTSVPEYVVSIDIGSVRLTDRCLPRHPAPADDLDAAATEARRLFAEVALPERPGTAVGVGGTFTALAAIAMDLDDYDPARVHRTDLTEHDLERLVARLAAMTIPEVAPIRSLGPDRAPVLLGGAVVAREAVRVAATGAVVVSENDLLVGLALALVG
jgi:exopolyphosphatase/guanosine-5'-triphosphate,3'-diphosphate pyrophosphatase